MHTYVYYIYNITIQGKHDPKNSPHDESPLQKKNGCPHHMGPGRPSDLKGTFQVNLWGAEVTLCDAPRAHVQYIYISIYYDTNKKHL